MAGGAPAGTQSFASSLTDLMTSLAVIFILLLVVFLKQAHDQSKKAKNEVQEQLKAFIQEKSLQMKQDPEDPLKLLVQVGESHLRFPVGGASLSSQGSEFVAGFFRNFGEKICQPALREKVDSIVIEGHTDTSGEKTPEGVRNNILLSQKRSYSVLEQGLKSVQASPETYECLLKLASASGRGSRSPIFTAGTYDPESSRRVEIKIKVRSSEQQFNTLAQAAANPGGVPQSQPANPASNPETSLQNPATSPQSLATSSPAPSAPPVQGTANAPAAPQKPELGPDMVPVQKPATEQQASPQGLAPGLAPAPPPTRR